MKQGEGRGERSEDVAHPPIKVLLGLTGETPAPGEGVADPRWRAHLDACPDCAKLFRELKALREAVRLGDAGDAPEAWIRPVEKLAKPRSFLSQLLGSFHGDVVFDSAAIEHPFGWTVAGGFSFTTETKWRG